MRRRCISKALTRRAPPQHSAESPLAPTYISHVHRHCLWTWTHIYSYSTRVRSQLLATASGKASRAHVSSPVTVAFCVVFCFLLPRTPYLGLRNTTSFIIFRGSCSSDMDLYLHRWLIKCASGGTNKVWYRKKYVSRNHDFYFRILIKQ